MLGVGVVKEVDLLPQYRRIIVTVNGDTRKDARSRIRKLNAALI